MLGSLQRQLRSPQKPQHVACPKFLLVPSPIFLSSSMFKYIVLVILKHRLTRHCVGIQIGQVMLALPNAVALTGLRAGVPLLFMYSLFSIFTIHLLNALYCEYKARKVSIMCRVLPVQPLLQCCCCCRCGCCCSCSCCDIHTHLQAERALT